ncbi:MAG: hypothetical protein ABJF10_18310 [Chthoniobacter sp.]|uniref:hypothetical protein n=1 Tax=Chthoniobacter sp. TaxID=2510640 RepID=UPI0032A6F033
MSSVRKQPHVLKILLWSAVPACLLVLAILLSPLVWAWEREHQWQAYRKTALAAGMVLDPPDLPPAIDPALNFAALAPFAAVPVDADGKPTQPATLPSDGLPMKLLPDIERNKRADFAGAREELHLEKVRDADLPATILRTCEERLGGKWPAVLAAEAKPQARFGVRDWLTTVTEKLPVADLRTAVQLHVIRAVAFQHMKRSAEALGEIRGGLRIAAAVQTHSSVVAYVLRSALLNLQMRAVWEGLEQGAWSNAELAALAKELAPLHASTGYARMTDAERSRLNTMVECLVAQSASGRARQIHQWFPGKEEGPAIMAFVMRWRAVLRDNQLAINRHMDGVRQQIDEKGDWQPTELPFDFDKMESPENVRYALAAITVARYTNAQKYALTAETFLRQAQLAIALERFRREHGNLPERLSEVVPQYLPRVLLDPMDGKEMRYARDDPRHYRLWSVGQDREDDGGKVEVKKETDGKEETDPEDIVWPGSAAGK